MPIKIKNAGNILSKRSYPLPFVCADQQVLSANVRNTLSYYNNEPVVSAVNKRVSLASSLEH